MKQEELINTLFAEMKRQGLTQKELGRRTGISQPALSCWRHGSRHPHLGGLYAILDALGLEIGLKRKK